MTAARVRTASVPDCPTLRLVLIVLVAVCGWPGALAQTVVPGGPRAIEADQGNHPPPASASDTTTEDGLSQDHVVAILQDRRGFMWFATGEGLTRSPLRTPASTGSTRRPGSSRPRASA